MRCESFLLFTYLTLQSSYSEQGLFAEFSPIAESPDSVQESPTSSKNERIGESGSYHHLSHQDEEKESRGDLGKDDSIDDVLDSSLKATKEIEDEDSLCASLNSLDILSDSALNIEEPSNSLQKLLQICNQSVSQFAISLFY